MLERRPRAGCMPLRERGPDRRYRRELRSRGTTCPKSPQRRGSRAVRSRRILGTVPAPEAIVVPRAAAGRPPTVFVADDDPETRALLAEQLRAEGYEVETIHDGFALLERL